MQRLWNLNWENITYDHDISGLMRGLIDWGVIEGGTVVGNKLQPVQAIVPLVRSNGQKILAFFESDEVIDLPTTGDYKVYIEVDQSKIDFGGNNAEDGTGIASIKTWPTLPSQNFLLLATATGGVVRLDRTVIPKVGQLVWRIAQVERKAATTESKVERLEATGTPSYLGITGIVWEKYTMQDTLFLQKAPTLVNSILPLNVWDTNTNKEQHIQKISSGVASNQLKLKMDKVLSPTSSVVIEVRKGIKVDVNEREAYWYGGWEVLATATLPYTKFSTEAQEITVDLNKSFQLPKGNLYSVVVMQQGGIVNANNYYRIYCDGTQWSEAFSAVAVNGANRQRNLAMPYCSSPAFQDELLVKTGSKGKVDCSLKIPIIDSINLNFWENRKHLETVTNNNLFNGVYSMVWEYTSWSLWLNGGVLLASFANNWEKSWSLTTTKGARFVVENIENTNNSKVFNLYHRNDYNYSNYNWTIGNIYLTLTHIILKSQIQKSCIPRETKNLGEQCSCTIFWKHTDNSWIWAEKVNTGAFKIAASWNKSGNSSETIEFFNKEVSMFLFELWALSWDQYSIVNPASWTIEVLVGEESYLSVAVNGSKTSNSCSIILPTGAVKFKLTTFNNEWRRVEMPYSIRRQS